MSLPLSRSTTIWRWVSSPSTTAGYTAFDKGEASRAVESLPAPARLRAVR